MRTRNDQGKSTFFAMELFQPKPNVLYSLDVAAQLAGVPRRSILIYCRAGLVRSILQPPYGIMTFTEEAIHTVRRIEHVRINHSADITLLKTLFDLLEEVEQLRSELRFLRTHR
jgi:DNA-binding transcriptional MerR regulator